MDDLSEKRKRAAELERRKDLAGAFEAAFLGPGMGIVGLKAFPFGHLPAVFVDMLIHFGFELVDIVLKDALELIHLGGRHGIPLGKDHQLFESGGKGSVFFKGEPGKDTVTHFFFFF